VAAAGGALTLVDDGVEHSVEVCYARAFVAGEEAGV
jgi:hypothetical protein